MRPEKLYLVDIVEAGEAIGRFLENVEQANFLNDELRQSAVVHKLTVIGEAAARLPEEFRSQYPDVKWRSAIGLRNIAVHEYFSVNWEIVWVTATQDIPPLLGQISSILKADYSDETE